MANGILFAELHTFAGERVEGTGLAGVATSPVLSLFKRRRGQLFTVLEPSLPDAETICRVLVETIEDEYFRDSSRSVTSSLSSAIGLANERLRAENSRLPPDRQLRIGLSCAAVRSDDVYVAQVAPANAFILHGGSVKRIFSSYSLSPDTSDNGTTRASDSLGSRLDSHINFGFSPLEQGDLVVLASGAYWKLVPDRYILEAARHLDPEMSASELYGCYLAHTQRPTTSILVVRASDLPAGQHRNGSGSESPGVPLPEERPASELEIRSEDAGVWAGRVSSQTWEEDESQGLDWVPGFRSETAGMAIRETSEARTARGRESAGASTPRGREPATAPSSPSVWDRLLFRRRGASRSGATPSSPYDPPFVPVGKPSVKLREEWPRQRAERGPGIVGRLLLTVVLLAVLAGLGWVGFNYWTSWQLGDPVALKQEAEQKRAASATADSKASARALLSESYDLLQRSLRAKDDESTRALAASVTADIDRIDQTVRVSEVKQLVDYSSLVEAKGDPTQLMLDGDTVYVMDEGLDRIYRYQLTADGNGVEEPGKHQSLVERGQKLDGVAIGDLLALTWMPAGQLRTSASLFALESGRSIVASDSKGILSRIVVSESDRWGIIQAISGFAGGLYLLDTKQKAVFYYPPTKNGYESQPYTIVDSKSKVDFSKAVDIGLDGNLYVLESSGAIWRFSREGRPQDFDGTLPGGPMKGARSLFASADARSVYVVDEAGESIVQFSPEGQLQRQFKADGKNVSFKDLRDIYVDEAGRKMYVLTQKSLFFFSLPPLQ